MATGGVAGLSLGDAAPRRPPPELLLALLPSEGGRLRSTDGRACSGSDGTPHDPDASGDGGRGSEDVRQTVPSGRFDGKNMAVSDATPAAAPPAAAFFPGAAIEEAM